MPVFCPQNLSEELMYDSMVYFHIKKNIRIYPGSKVQIVNLPSEK